jgi:transcriptional regulator GlxA family with amidase domain
VGRPAALQTSAGLTLSCAPLSTAPRSIHTLVVPGAPREPLQRALGDQVLMTWLARAATRATRVTSVCSGAFLLGALGLLDGRRATTHWSATEALAKFLPQVRVDHEALYVEDGKVWTSAGVTTGIDLALALVAHDLGPELALEVARELVLHLVRPGKQSQFSAPLRMQRQASGNLQLLIPWLEARLHAEVTVEDMALAMGMSERTFNRRCVNAFAMPPARLLSELRFDRARTLLGDAGLSMRDIARQCGFVDLTAFSKAFAKRYNTSPSSYRRAFALV